MPEATELELVLGVAERLRDELGASAADETVPGDGAFADRKHLASWGSTDIRSAQLAARLNLTLAQIAAAETDPTEEGADSISTKRVVAALARTELVVRGELMRGDETALREQLPGFVFLVVLPGAGMDRALELAHRTNALLDEALPRAHDD